VPALVLPLAVLASCVVTAWYCKIKFRTKFISGFLWNLFFLVAALGVSVILSILIFDNSYDGQTYHYETQAAIIRGWNPIKHELRSGSANIFFINHYAKGYETAAACFWAFFKNPESGKALNILLMASCFFYVSYFLQELKLFENQFWLFFISLLIAFNPVTVYQLFTFYVDGQIAALITILIASLYLSMKKRSSLHLIIALIAFCIMSDIKFTGLIYSIVIFGFFGLWMIIKRMNIFRFAVAGVGGIMVTLFLIGFNPYVTNTIQQSNPFYPLVGKNKIDIITPVQPASFAHKNFLQKFAEANFSHSHNIHGHAVTPEPRLKIPFTFSINEWLVFKGSECRIAGYGPLFGGILLICFIMLLITLFIKKRSIIKEDAFIIFILVYLSMIINPEMWMSRYVPQLWLFPFCIIWLFRKQFYAGVFNKITYFLFGAITLNIVGIAIVNWGVAGLISYKMHKELAWLNLLDKPVQIITNDFIAARERIKLAGIVMNEVSGDSSSALLKGNVYKLQNSQAIILLPPRVSKFENTGILKLLDKKLE
jgi:hypothetical protein